MTIISILKSRLHFRKFLFVREDYEIIRGQQSIVVTIRAQKRSLPRCHVCGTPAPMYDYCTPDWRYFLFIPCWGLPVYFKYRMRRCSCPRCKSVKVEQVLWAEGKRRTCIMMGHFLVSLAKDISSWKRFARMCRIPWQTLADAIADYVEDSLEKRDLSGVTAIGVDEIAWKRRHRYITLVYQIDKGRRRLLWVGENRTKETLDAFFDDMETRCKGFAKRLKVICSDMWQAYRAIIAERAPQALHVLDKFHISGYLSKAIDKIRADEHRQLLKENKGHILKNQKYLFLKDPLQLSQEKKLRLNELMGMNLKTTKAYVLMQQFREIWSLDCAEAARSAFESWITTVNRTKLNELKKGARMIKEKLDLILNYFRAGKCFSSGIVEGHNRIVNLVIRKAFGFRSFFVARTALLYELGGFPPPEVHHRFW